MEQDLSKQFKDELSSRHLTILCAESVTAGLLSSTIANTPGASSVLKGSIVTYNKKVKSAILGVRKRTLKEHTAESIETTVAMVKGLKKLRIDADILVAVTGVASPGTPEYPTDKPLGQIYVAIIYDGKLRTYDEVINKTERNDIRMGAVEFILKTILELVTNKKISE